MFASLILTVIIFGFYPEPLIKTMNVSVNDLLNYYQIEINNQISMKIND